MKKNKKILLSLFGVAAAASVVTLPLVLTSCSSQATQKTNWDNHSTSSNNKHNEINTPHLDNPFNKNLNDVSLSNNTCTEIIRFLLAKDNWSLPFNPNSNSIYSNGKNVVNNSIISNSKFIRFDNTNKSREVRYLNNLPHIVNYLSTWQTSQTPSNLTQNLQNMIAEIVSTLKLFNSSISVVDFPVSVSEYGTNGTYIISIGNTLDNSGKIAEVVYDYKTNEITNNSTPYMTGSIPQNLKLSLNEYLAISKKFTSNWVKNAANSLTTAIQSINEQNNWNTQLPSEWISTQNFKPLEINNFNSFFGQGCSPINIASIINNNPTGPFYSILIPNLILLNCLQYLINDNSDSNAIGNIWFDLVPNNNDGVVNIQIYSGNNQQKNIITSSSVNAFVSEQEYKNSINSEIQQLQQMNWINLINSNYGGNYNLLPENALSAIQNACLGAIADALSSNNNWRISNNSNNNFSFKCTPNNNNGTISVVISDNLDPSLKTIFSGTITGFLTPTTKKQAIKKEVEQLVKSLKANSGSYTNSEGNTVNFPLLNQIISNKIVSQASTYYTNLIYSLIGYNSLITSNQFSVKISKDITKGTLTVDIENTSDNNAIIFTKTYNFWTTEKYDSVKLKIESELKQINTTNLQSNALNYWNNNYGDGCNLSELVMQDLQSSFQTIFNEQLKSGWIINESDFTVTVTPNYNTGNVTVTINCIYENNKPFYTTTLTGFSE